MENGKVKKVWNVSRGRIERKIAYRTEEIEYQEIIVNAEFEGTQTPEKVKQITEVIDEAARKIMKIVEEW